MKILLVCLLTALTACASGSKCRCEGSVAAPAQALVLMTDFSLKDGAISAMKGVAQQVNPRLVVSDLTHEIPPYNIWEGAYRLNQTYKYWPAGTVFVTVVDPGVGSERHSIVARSKSGHYFVGPDNGLYTLIDDENGLESVRVIDEAKQRLKGSAESNTFHGRDLYVYVGARLAAGQLSYEDAGPLATSPIEKIKYQKAEFVGGKEIKGLIPILDPNYGNVWSNIPKDLLQKHFPEATSLQVKILKGTKTVFEGRIPLVNTFAAVGKGKPLLYYNSLLNVALALNQDDFAKRHHVGSGPEWSLVLSK